MCAMHIHKYSMVAFKVFIILSFDVEIPKHLTHNIITIIHLILSGLSQ